jgi:hypothetical protein
VAVFHTVTNILVLFLCGRHDECEDEQKRQAPSHLDSTTVDWEIKMSFCDISANNRTVCGQVLKKFLWERDVKINN